MTCIEFNPTSTLLSAPGEITSAVFRLGEPGRISLVTAFPNVCDTSSVTAAAWCGGGFTAA